jgi:arylsulfatase
LSRAFLARRLAVLPLLTASFLACHRERSPVSTLWIVVDTLRADHVGAYGYERDTLPALRPLIENGTLFERVYVTQTETTPSIGSMLTGLQPWKHGVQALYTSLHPDNVTLAEMLRERGYQTAAFVSSFVMSRRFSGLDQGFDVYDDFVEDRERFRENFERRAAGTLGLARVWLEKRDPRRPFFLFVHLIDPHGPYDPPSPFDARFRSVDKIPIAGVIPAYQAFPGQTDLNFYRDRYDGEVAYLSEQLRGFLDFLRQEQLFDPTLMLFIADHGESLGEHGIYFEHGWDTHEEVARVPFIVKPPAGRGARGSRVAPPVSAVDLLPTTLEMLGLPQLPGLDGRSLARALNGAALEPREVFVQSRRREQQWARVDGTRKTMLVESEGKTDWFSYDLGSDPTEKTFLSATAPEREALAAWVRRARAHRTPFQPLRNVLEATRTELVQQRLQEREREDLERLRALGYVR